LYWTELLSRNRFTNASESKLTDEQYDVIFTKARPWTRDEVEESKKSEWMEQDEWYRREVLSLWLEDKNRDTMSIDW